MLGSLISYILNYGCAVQCRVSFHCAGPGYQLLRTSLTVSGGQLGEWPSHMYGHQALSIIAPEPTLIHIYMWQNTKAHLQCMRELHV